MLATRAPLFLAALALAACAATPPSAPSIVALPGTGKSLEQFNRDDTECRQYGHKQISAIDPATVDTYELQRRYDGAFVQCMYAKGHRVPVTGHYTGSGDRPAPAGPPAPAYFPPPPPPPPAK